MKEQLVSLERLNSFIDKAAKEANVSLLATGVNPGFVMDRFPISMLAVCQRTDHIRVERIQDASSRRLPFQKKIGAGCTIAEFNKLKEEGVLRHVGLRESADMIGAVLGWKFDEYTETIDPIMAQEELSTEYINIKPGCAAGVQQLGVGGLKGLDPPKPGPDEHANPLRLLLVELQTGVFLGHVGRGHGELGEAVHGLGQPLVDPLRGIEPLHLTGELRRELARVEQRYWRGAALAGQERRPGLLSALPDRRQKTDPGNNDTSLHGTPR